MKSLCTVSGWIAAAVVAVLMFTARQGREPRCMAGPADRAAGRGDDALQGSGQDSGSVDAAVREATEPEHGEEGEEEAGAAAYECPGDDWNPPQDMRGLEACLLLLASATPQERALAERIAAASKSGDLDALLAAAKEALPCPETKVRAMAVAAIAGMDPSEAVEERVEALKAFFNDDSYYVRQQALEGVGDMLCRMEDRDKAFDIVFEVVADADNYKHGFSKGEARGLLQAVKRKFYDDDGKPSPDGDLRAMLAFAELAKSDDKYVACFSRVMVEDIFTGGREYPEGTPDDYMPSEEEIRRKVAPAKAEYEAKKAEFEEALAKFQDEDEKAEKAKMYLSKAEDFAAEAKERYGDTEKAAEWLAEELSVLEARMHDPQEWNAIRF